MPPRTAATPHIGRKIERIRTLKGIKQELLAEKIGLSQSALSKIEQSEKVDEGKLMSIAEALEVSVETIKSFNEDAPVNIIANTFNSHDQSSSILLYPTFNPIDKLVNVFEENKNLYERLLESERKRNELLESLLKKYEGSK